MTVEYVSIGSVKPYEKNAMKHPDSQVEKIANSLREFGWQQPLVIDKNNIVVVGHGRLAAAKKLGMKEVPVVRADTLTDQQIKAYRLADNKLNSLGEIDEDILNVELDSITDLKMDDFGFATSLDDDEDDDYDDGYYGDERERTYNTVNLNEYDASRVSGYYQFPTLKACKFVPESLIGFNYIKSTPEYKSGVHFFLDDYQFERIWNQPHEMIERLRPFSCVLTPDFSLYLDMPMAMKVWNIYRARLIGQMMQDAGLEVIPTLTWAEPATYDFVFDGLPQKGTVAVSTVGVMNDKNAREIWADGMNTAIKKLKPSTIVCYGAKIDFDFGKIPVKYIDARGFKKEGA